MAPLIKLKTISLPYFITDANILLASCCNIVKRNNSFLSAGQTSNFQNVSVSSTDPRCHQLFGYLIDRSSRRNVSICSERQKILEEPVQSDEKIIYTSRSNHLHLVTKGDVAFKSIIRLAGECLEFIAEV
jgi:hypothetical protein